MNQNLTEIVFILDRSGSMGDLVEDTIGGFNSFVEKQKQEPGEALLTTVLFDHKYEILYSGVNLKDVKPLTEKEYYARGMTALLDAVGKTINEVGDRLYKTPEDKRPGKVIVVITTDGYENSSCEFTNEQVRTLIQHQTDKYNWTFLFLGATIDAKDTAVDMGIVAACAASYSPNEVGTQSLYAAVDHQTRRMRKGEAPDGDLQDQVE